MCILDIGLAQLCWGLFATRCLHLIILMNIIYTCMMGEIWMLVELLANIPLTKQETLSNPAKT